MGIDSQRSIDFNTAYRRLPDRVRQGLQDDDVSRNCIKAIHNAGALDRESRTNPDLYGNQTGVEVTEPWSRQHPLDTVLTGDEKRQWRLNNIPAGSIGKYSDHSSQSMLPKDHFYDSTYGSGDEKASSTSLFTPSGQEDRSVLGDSRATPALSDMKTWSDLDSDVSTGASLLDQVLAKRAKQQAASGPRQYRWRTKTSMTRNTGTSAVPSTPWRSRADTASTAFSGRSEVDTRRSSSAPPHSSRPSRGLYRSGADQSSQGWESDASTGSRRSVSFAQPPTEAWEWDRMSPVSDADDEDTDLEEDTRRRPHPSSGRPSALKPTKGRGRLAPFQSAHANSDRSVPSSAPPSSIPPSNSSQFHSRPPSHPRSSSADTELSNTQRPSQSSRPPRYLRSTPPYDPPYRPTFDGDEEEDLFYETSEYTGPSTLSRLASAAGTGMKYAAGAAALGGAAYYGKSAIDANPELLSNASTMLSGYGESALESAKSFGANASTLGSTVFEGGKSMLGNAGSSIGDFASGAGTALSTLTSAGTGVISGLSSSAAETVAKHPWMETVGSLAKSQMQQRAMGWAFNKAFGKV